MSDIRLTVQEETLRLFVLDSLAILGMANVFSAGQRMNTWLHIGTNVFSLDDSALLIGRAATNPLISGGSHAVRDESTYISTAVGGYASFDSIPVVSGPGAYSHLNCFQARASYQGAVSIDALTAFYTALNHTGAGTIGYTYGMHIVDPAGGGPITNNIGIWIDHLTAGTSTNYAIYSAGDAASYHGGFWQVGGNILAAGTLAGSNFYTEANSNTVGLGIGIPVMNYPASVPGYLSTWIGHNAGHSTTGSNYATYVGAFAGFSNLTGAGGVYLGHQAGYYETGSNKLFIDNAARGNEGTARLMALIYGVFDAALANQSIAFNAGNMGFFGHAAAPQPAAYTSANVTADRSFDADTVAIAELADVVGTLIADLQSIGLLP